MKVKRTVERRKEDKNVRKSSMVRGDVKVRKR